MRDWPSGKVSVTVSKFNALFGFITGCFYLHIYAVFSMFSASDTILRVSEAWYNVQCTHKLTSAGKTCPVISRFDRSCNAPTTLTGRL